MVAERVLGVAEQVLAVDEGDGALDPGLVRHAVLKK